MISAGRSVGDERRTFFDVIVVGYGPSAATLVNFLGQTGLSVAVVDKRTDVWPLPRAGHVDDEIVRVWQGMGLAGELLPLLTDCAPYEFFTRDWRRYFSFDMPDGISDQGYRRHYFFNQPMFERTVRASNGSFPNVTELLGYEVVTIDDVGDSVVVTLKDAVSGEASEVRAQYVAAFDGASSPTRNRLGVTMTEYDEGQDWLIVMVRVTDPDIALPELCFEWAGEERAVSFMTPFPGNMRLWEFKVLPGEDPRELETPERVWEFLKPWISPEQGELMRADVYTFRSVLADQWRVGRVFIGGDAAHQMTPKAGEGLGSGFRDAVNLAWKLAAVIQHGAPDSLLDTYESERKPNVLAYIELSRFLIDLLSAAAAGQAPPDEGSTSEPIQPLGPGLHGDRPPPAATRSRQPRLGDGTLLDDRVGYAFAVIVDPSLLADVSDATRSVWEAIGAVVVSEKSSDIESWLADLGVGAIIVRPDRFLLDVAADADQLDQLTAELATRLGLDATSGLHLLPGQSVA